DDLGELYYQDEENVVDYDQSWDDFYWADDGWSWVEPAAMSEYWLDGPDYWDYEGESWNESDEAWTDADYEGYYDEHPDYHNEATADDASNADDSSLSPKASENYPMKGGKGVGCSVCGSRWHSSSSCPVGGAKGKGGYRGSGKGYGKGYGKGKKGSSKSKGKGKGKWQPRKGKGKSKGYYGYSTKTLTQSFTASRPSWTPERPKTVHFRLDHDERDTIINLRNTKDDHEKADRSESATGSHEATAKRLDFTFATSIYNATTTYHTVRGEKRRGLLVDPGAASGLIGSETLRDLMDSCLDQAHRDEVKWCHDKTNNVSGISGTPEATLGEVHLPLRMSGVAGTFSADVLGGEGSLCPALLSNPALRKQRAVVWCDYFANGDGVMIVPVIGTKDDGTQHSAGWHYMRLLLTDSGHYLLPVDDQRKVSQHSRKDIEHHLFTWTSEIEQRWSDVRHCFLTKRGEHNSRERERCEVSAGTQQGNTADSNPLETTSSTTSAAASPASTSTVRSGTSITARSESLLTSSDFEKDSVGDSSFTSAGSNPKTTSSTTSGVLYDVAAPQSGPFMSSVAAPQSGPKIAGVSGDISSTALPSKPFLDGPPMTPENLPEIDSWSLEGDYLVRRRKVPRRILFTPRCALDCPVDHAVIQAERTTYMSKIPRRLGEAVLRDDWETANTPNKDMEQLWIGRTVFKVRKAKEKAAASPTTTASDLSLDPKDFPHYDGDMFPDHWSEDKKLKMHEKYKAIPEEFYTKSGRKPITPRNVKPWLKAAAGRGLRWQFWELCSGSGRLSLILMTASMMTGFPVDYRYGWDMSWPEHQQLLRQCYQEFIPAHVFAAPTCTPWTTASSSKDREIRMQERQHELPTLEFLYEVMLQQHNGNLGFSLEQPYASAMLIDSPISRLRDIVGVRAWRTDQCMLGARDEKNAPVRKSTAILSNRRWQQVIKRCDNHRGQPHGVLQGQVRGINRTAMAAVYPKRLCQLYGQDLWRILRKDVVMSCKPWPHQLVWTHSMYYSCERCQLGRSAPPGVEHNLIPGQCRYGQPGMRRTRAPRTAPPEPPPEVPPAPEEPTAPVTTTTPTAEGSTALKKTDLEDATGPFKFLARNGDYTRVALDCDRSLPLTMEQRLFLKAALLQMLRTCIDIFNKNTSVDYDHWLEDPILLQVFQEIFQQHFSVLGVMCSLRPWRRKVPDPYLSSACAPLRLLVSGNMQKWHVHAIEDMRLMSHSQLHAAVDEADWHFHFFGVKEGDSGADLLRPDLGDPDGPRGSSSRAGRPAAPYPSDPSERKNDGRSVAATDPELHAPPPEAEADGSEPAPAGSGAAMDEEEFEAVRPEADGEEGDKVLKPLFDFKKAGVFVTMSGIQEQSFAYLRKLVEQLSPYKTVIVGRGEERGADLVAQGLYHLPFFPRDL
ncbi:unnamed protein product, partial [Symbiodinium necroappetens]